MNRKNRILRGVAASPGVAIGRAFLLGVEELKVPRRIVDPDQSEKDIERFKEALAKTKEELDALRDQTSLRLGQDQARVFEVHLLMLDDPSVVDETIEEVKRTRVNVEHVFGRKMQEFIDHFDSIDDDYFRHRRSDIHDVGTRVLAHLLGSEQEALAKLKEDVVVVARDLAPSVTAQMRTESIIGFVTDLGGITSHTAIMARSLEIPAVVGAGDITRWVEPGDMVIVDGSHGTIVINPDQETLLEYQRAQADFLTFEERLLTVRDLPAETLDGRKVDLAANIELPEEAKMIRNHGAEGVGLYRTEFLFMRTVLPSEEEQYEAYRTVVEASSPYPSIIRTVDLGGDKFISHFDVPREMNPFLGWRGIRLSLQQRDFFKLQLRAILRAAHHGPVKLIFPMVSCLEEVRQAKEVLRETVEELKRSGTPHAEPEEIGIMVEVPSAALTAEYLAKELDFFSLGTNDLIQYCLAIDRVNPKICHLYEPLHPAVLQLVKRTVDAGHKEGIWVGLCGEMGADPVAVLALVGLGLDELSMSPLMIPEIKEVIRSINYKKAQAIAQKTLAMSSGEEIRAYLRNEAEQLYSQLLSRMGDFQPCAQR